MAGAVRAAAVAAARPAAVIPARRRHFADHEVGRNSPVTQEAREGAAAIGQRGEQHLRLERTLARRARLEQPARVRRQRHPFGLRRITPHPNPLLPILECRGKRRPVDAGGIEGRPGQLVGAQQAQQQVFGADELVAQPLGFGTRFTQDALGALAQGLIRHGRGK